MVIVSNTPLNPHKTPRLALWLRLPGALPFPVLYSVGAVIAWLLRVLLRFRLRTVRQNLRRCFPDMPAAEFNATVSRHYREMTQTALELFKLATLSAAELRERVRFINTQALDVELQAGRSVMVLAAHTGNWEWLLQRVAVEFGPLFICAYKPLRNQRLEGDLLALRSRFGAQMVAAKGLLRTLLRTRQAHVTGLAADQMPLTSPTRVWLQFMGVPTAFYPGPAEIATRYHYSAYFLAMRRQSPGYYEVEFQLIARAAEDIDAATFTARYAARVEEQLRLAPSDWAWGHQRWKLAPPEA